jgi:hypothetical protein
MPGLVLNREGTVVTHYGKHLLSTRDPAQRRHEQSSLAAVCIRDVRRLRIGSELSVWGAETARAAYHTEMLSVPGVFGAVPVLASRVTPR